jgi:hypothetical protein
MHDFYRWRLANAFATTRQAAEEQDPAKSRARFAEAAATRLSELRARHDAEPELVICGTANINALREVPPGQGGFCVTFDKDSVVLHREKALADRTRPAPATTGPPATTRPRASSAPRRGRRTTRPCWATAGPPCSTSRRSAGRRSPR